MARGKDSKQGVQTPSALGAGGGPISEPHELILPCEEPEEAVEGVQEGGSPTGSIWLHPTCHELASTITLCQCPPQSPTQLFTRVFQSRGQLILFPSHLNFQSPISVLWGSSSLSLTSIPPAAPTAFFFFSRFLFHSNASTFPASPSTLHVPSSSHPSFPDTCIYSLWPPCIRAWKKSDQLSRFA